MLRKEMRDGHALLGRSPYIVSPPNVHAAPLLSSFMFHPPTIVEPLSLLPLTIVESSEEKKTQIKNLYKGTFVALGFTGSIAYNWSQPNMKSNVKIIHARIRLLEEN